MSLAERLRALADEVEALEKPPAPPPPAPAPAPAPEPAPSGDIGVLQSRTLDMTALLFFREFHIGGRYTRNVANVMLPHERVPFLAEDRTPGATPRFKSAGYTLLCDGDPIARATPAAGTAAGSFLPNWAGVPDGWHLFDIAPDDGPEVAHPFWMCMRRQPFAQTWAPAMAGSYHLDGTARWAKMPATISGQGQPLAPRQALPFSNTPSASTLFRRNLVPTINGDPPYLRAMANGVKTCMNVHGYAWTTMLAKVPGVALRDGPRGIGTAVYITHMQVGRRGGVYCVDPWRVFHVDATGAVRTLFGWRSGEAGLEMVGDWSAIPEERRGLHEAWGKAWDERTIADAAADTSLLIDRGDGVLEHPHSAGPTLFVADTQNNRILKAVFDPRDHAKPPVITEFITGMADPFDVVYIGNGQIAVSERTAHRIDIYDAGTGAYVRELVKGAALSSVSKNREVTRLAPLEVIRAEDCVGPEGLFYQDGAVWFGSLAMGQVRKIDLLTGAVSVVCTPTLSSKALFMKIAVSDGTTGPRGTVFIAAWGHDKVAHLPNGTRWGFWTAGSSVIPHGRGGKWTGLGYDTAIGVGAGRILLGSADYGLAEITQVQASDPPAINEALYSQGLKEYEAAGYRLTHGIDGHGQFGYPLPWGESGAMDYYLQAHGHR